MAEIPLWPAGAVFWTGPCALYAPHSADLCCVAQGRPIGRGGTPTASAGRGMFGLHTPPEDAPCHMPVRPRRCGGAFGCVCGGAGDPRPSPRHPRRGACVGRCRPCPKSRELSKTSPDWKPSGLAKMRPSAPDLVWIWAGDRFQPHPTAAGGRFWAVPGHPCAAHTTRGGRHRLRALAFTRRSCCHIDIW